MDRRSFVLTGLSTVTTGASRTALSDTGKRAWIELRFFHLRNDLNRSRLESFLREGFLATFKKMGRSPVGIFSVTMGSHMPMLLTIVSFPSMAQMENDLDQLSRDAVWKKALDELDQPQAAAYSRIESVLLRAFASTPAIELPMMGPGRPAHVFELRTYESRNMRASETKIKMFDGGEIEIFRKCGMLPVFFGQSMIGSGLPSLTYMLAYDSTEAREEAWRKFINHPDWLKLKSAPGLADSEIVSRISNCFLRPTDYSEIQ